MGAIYLLVARGLFNLSTWALFVGLLFSGLKAAFDAGALVGFGVDGLGFGAPISRRETFDRGAAPARA